MRLFSLVQYLVLIALFGVNYDITGQIVNIERQRISTDSTGWYGSAHFSFAGSKATKSIASLYTGGLVEYKSKSNKDLWLLIADFSLISGDNEKFTNSCFGHLRYNRKLGDVIRWEFFTQVQYNALTKIDQRILAGTGIRLKLTPYEYARFYYGLAYMYEYEALLDPSLYENNHRLSSYFSFTLLPEETVIFTFTFYAQPLLKDLSDFKLSNETSLELVITRKLSLSTTFRYGYDAVPPIDVPKSTYAFANTLKLEF